MDATKIELNWSRLLGFSQAKPGADIFRGAPKIGAKQCRGIGQQIAQSRE